MLKLSKEQLLLSLQEASKVIKVGKLYLHTKSGGVYRVKGLNIDEETQKIRVSYSIKVGNRDLEFSRKYESFISENKAGVKRFELLD